MAGGFDVFEFVKEVALNELAILGCEVDLAV